MRVAPEVPRIRRGGLAARTGWVACAALLGLGGCKDATAPGELREGLPVSAPAREGIDSAALATLISHAREQHSEALIILRHGRIVYEDDFGFGDTRIYAMSASKSFVSLAYGFLLDEGKLKSLDTRVVDVLPGFGFSGACKGEMTIRQLLSQTSGLDPSRAMSNGNDIAAYALRVACMFPPGGGWQYSNGGVDLLAALAGKLAGKPMDAYLNEKLFAPLGITSVTWNKDIKGVPYGAGEMQIRALDMAKVGQALLDGGKWQGKQVIPAAWVAGIGEPSNSFEPTYGLLWWRGVYVTSVGVTDDLIRQWRNYGLSESSQLALAGLVGRVFTPWQPYYDAVRGALGPAGYAEWLQLVRSGDHIPQLRNLSVGPLLCYYAAGWLGQFLVIVPDKDLVGVRMRRKRVSDGAGAEVDGYPAFPADVAALVK